MTPITFILLSVLALISLPSQGQTEPVSFFLNNEEQVVQEDSLEQFYLKLSNQTLSSDILRVNYSNLEMNDSTSYYLVIIPDDKKGVTSIIHANSEQTLAFNMGIIFNAQALRMRKYYILHVVQQKEKINGEMDQKIISTCLLYI